MRVVARPQAALRAARSAGPPPAPFPIYLALPTSGPVAVHVLCGSPGHRRKTDATQNRRHTKLAHPHDARAVALRSAPRRRQHMKTHPSSKRASRHVSLPSRSRPEPSEHTLSLDHVVAHATLRDSAYTVACGEWCARMHSISTSRRPPQRPAQTPQAHGGGGRATLFGWRGRPNGLSHSNFPHTNGL